MREIPPPELEKIEKPDLGQGSRNDNLLMGQKLKFLKYLKYDMLYIKLDQNFMLNVILTFKMLP